MSEQRGKLDDLGRKLETLKDNIPVNYELKQRLRQDFVTARRRPKLAYAVILAAVVALFLWLGLGNQNNSPGPILAADLKISNQISLVDIASGSNMPPVISNKVIYLPVVEQGTFALPSQPVKNLNITRITGKDILFDSLSHDGQTATFSNSKGIYLYDLKTKKSRTLVEGNDYDIYYEDPSWSQDDKTLLITRRQIQWQEHGFEVKSLDIYEVNRDGSNLRKICSGSNASYVPGCQDIVFERGGQIILRKAGGQEMTVDNGRFPAPSPNGSYIAYVKRSLQEKKLSEYARVLTDLADVYICSVDNFADQKKLTANYPFRHTDEERWFKGLNPAHGEQSLVFTGKYYFYDPVWGEDENTLYVLKSGSSEKEPMRVTRIDLGSGNLAAVDTVARWLEACINRDDDYARSLMKSPPEILTISNPHPVAYSIIESGEENGQTYVDARGTLAYNADCYYLLDQTRFYLVKSEEGYQIDRTVKGENAIQVYGQKDGIYIREGTDGQGKRLLKIDGLTPPGAENMRRLSSLAYSPEKQLILYTIQEADSFTIYAHDLKNNRRVFSQRITDGESAVMDISFDGSQRYAAIRYFGDSHQSLKLYDVQNQTMIKTPFLDNTTKAFWADQYLLVEKPIARSTIRFLYSPATGTASLGTK